MQRPIRHARADCELLSIEIIDKISYKTFSSNVSFDGMLIKHNKDQPFKGQSISLIKVGFESFRFLNKDFPSSIVLEVRKVRKSNDALAVEILSAADSYEKKIWDMLVKMLLEKKISSPIEF